MRSSFSNYTASTPFKDPNGSQSVLHDHRMPEACPQHVSDPPTHCLRAAGVLRHYRESDDHRVDLTTILPAPLPVYPTQCDYCGAEAKPSLVLTPSQRPETAPAFCCARWQTLCEMLLSSRYLLRERLDLPCGLRNLSELTTFEDYLDRPRAAKTSTQPVKVSHFRLSCVLKRPTETSRGTTEVDEQPLVPFCNHKPLLFGMCYHQNGTEFQQKFYSNGRTFLTVFPEGSAQLFYPSGLLALIVVVTENQRVCIVYDDCNAPMQPMRAIFQSDGRATCYHSNGDIWLVLNTSGGQCWNEGGSRVRHWSWGSQSLIPTPLHPVFLSLNRAVGVRVLGRGQVFVSFLAGGQQARFSVGTCYVQSEGENAEVTAGPPLLEEELFVLAVKIRIHLAFQHLHRSLMMTPFYPQLPRTTKGPHLHMAAQKLLALSADMNTIDSETAFICKWLHDDL